MGVEKETNARGKQMRKDRSQPPQDLLDKVRLIAAYLGELPAELKAQLRADLRQDFLTKMESLRLQLNDLLSKMQVSIQVGHVTRGPFGLFVTTRKLRYRVTEGGIVRLEFKDWVGATERTLEALHKYQPGDWEHKLNPAYQKCLDFYNEREKVRALEEQLNRIFSCERPETEEAIRPLEELLTIDLNFGPGWSKLAWAYLETGRHEAAEKAVITALELNPDDLQAQKVFLALPVFDFVDIEATIKHFERILTEMPDFALARSSLGMAYMYVGRFTDALQALNTAVNLAPNNAWCHFNLSSIYFGALHHSTPPGIEELRRSPEIVRKTWGYLMSEEELEFMRTPLLDELYDRYPQFANLTLQALGCSYEHARYMAEQHAKDTIRLSTVNQLTEKANDRLVTLRMIDQTRHLPCE